VDAHAVALLEGGQVAAADRRDGHIMAAPVELFRQMPDQNLDAADHGRIEVRDHQDSHRALILERRSRRRTFSSGTRSGNSCRSL